MTEITITTAAAQTVPVRRGIATIANDKVLDWLLPFLESHRTLSPGIPLHVIPYDDNVAKTKQAAELYGACFNDVESGELDRLARRLYPLFPKHRRRLRKFLSLELPLDEVIYIDVDTILLRDFTPLFGQLDGTRDFIVACATREYVYNANRAKYPFLQDAKLFNDGFFITSPDILRLEDFFDVIAQDESVFHDVRKRGMLFAQPLTNFVVHRKGLRIASLTDCIPTASGESYHKAQNVRLCDDGPIDVHGKEIYFAHWAGATGLPKGRVFDNLWLDFAARAAGRTHSFV